jgi:hypothetical protein
MVMAPSLVSVPLSLGESSGQLWQSLMEHAAQCLLPVEAHDDGDAANNTVPAMVLNLEARDPEKRLDALATLAEIEHWGTNVVQALVACAQVDASSRVREVACSMLAEEALRGSGDAACAVARMSQDAHPGVRSIAVSALTCLAEVGLRHTDEAAARVLQRMDMGFRWKTQF